MSRPKRRKASKPSRYRVHSGAGDGLLIDWRWFSPPTLFLFVLYLAGLGGAVFVYHQSATVDGNADGPRWGPILRAGAGLFIAGSTWAMAAAFVNRTTLRVSGGWLTVTHTPLWWPGGQRFRVDDVTDVTVTEQRLSEEAGTPDTFVYRVHVWLRSTYPHTILGEIYDRKEAEVVKQKLLAVLCPHDPSSG